MKRIFTLIAVLGIVVTAMAQRPLVTLSHNGELSFFTSLSAFTEAIDSAQNGDIIYLSEGNFAVTNGSLTLKKRLSIVGCGYKSHILADISICLNEQYLMDAPMFDGVRLHMLDFYNSSQRDYLGNVEIRKSWIQTLQDPNCGGVNLFVDRCYIENVTATSGGNNITYQNSKIGLLDGSYAAYYCAIINCNIGSAYCPPMTVTGSIIGFLNNESYSTYNHNLFNTCMPISKKSSSNRVKYYECYFVEASEDGTTNILDDNLECTLDLVSLGYLDENGTQVGVYGGDFPFSETPSVPTVDSVKSSVVYDSEANQLKVTISVAPN